MRFPKTIAMAVFCLAVGMPPPSFGESVCYGTVGNGRLEGGVKLPAEGPNFSAYSKLAGSLGRTYVHSKVRDVVVSAYQELERSAPGKVYVYGETGFAKGGPFKPHRTHQNGTSVDFMVPVIDAANRSVPLPTNALNRYGYDIEFDGEGRYKEYRIDFEAMAEHLIQLKQAAEKQGIGIALVIFDPTLMPKLFRTKHGERLKELKFMKGQAWVRHDEHYHVDFAMTCKAR